MNKRMLMGTLVLAALGLGACGSSSESTEAGGALPSSPTVAAQESSGPGTDDAKDCNVPYGDPPAQLADLTTGLGSGALGDLLNLTNQCLVDGGETLDWTDATGQPRKACLLTPPGATRSTPLPLVVFLQGSLVPATPQLILNDWVGRYKTQDLTGDAKRPGFTLLMPIGRNTHHFYPYPDDYALGFDNWYRNLDRGSPLLNVDVAAIDAFIQQVKDRGIVDDDRLYVTGWSNGGAMAELYSLNTPEVAATATYSATAPFSDWRDPCAQAPFATTLPPVMDIHNSCDVIGTCQTTTAYHQQLGKLFPKLAQKVVLLNESRQQTDACDALCANDTLEGNPLGLTNHLIWPQKWNDQLLDWLRDHPRSSRK